MLVHRSQTDPFTRVSMTIDDAREEVELRDEIAQWLSENLVSADDANDDARNPTRIRDERLDTTQQ